jgi:hypothetical protein
MPTTVRVAGETATQAPYHTNAAPHHCPTLPTYRCECRRGAGKVRRGHVDAVDAEAGDCVHTVPLVPLHQYTQVLPTARGEARQRCGGGAGDGRGGLAPGHTHTHTHTHAHTSRNGGGGHALRSSLSPALWDNPSHIRHRWDSQITHMGGGGRGCAGNSLYKTATGVHLTQTKPNYGRCHDHYRQRAGVQHKCSRRPRTK